MLPPEFMRLISRYTSFAEIHRIQMLVGHFTLAEALIMSTKEVIFIPIKSTSGCFALIFEDASQNQPGSRVASLWKRVIQSNLTEEQTITASDTEPEPTVGLGPSSSEKMANLAKRRWELARSTGQRQLCFVDNMNAAKARRRMKEAQTQTDLLGPTSYSSADLRATTGLSFLLECLRNLGFKKPTYSDTCYKIAMLLHLSSAKTYKILRQLLRLPAISSLYRHFGSRLSEIRVELTSLERIEQMVGAVKDEIAKLRSQGAAVNTHFTLAVDAFAFRSFVGSPLGFPGCQQSKQQTEVLSERGVKYNNGFLFLLISHDYQIPVKTVHISAQTSGSYNKTIASVTEQIIDCAHRNDLRVWCRATDGDPGVSGEHNKFYFNHIHGKSSNFSTLLKRIHRLLSADDSLWIPISDPLHVFKNVRSHILRHPIVLYPNTSGVNLDCMRSVLSLGNALTDETQLGKMRDCYVISLFTFSNVAKLLEAKEYASASILFPFACWASCIFSPSLDLSFRLFLVELSFQMLSDWLSQYAEIKMGEEETKALTKEQRKCDGQKLCDAHFIRRMLNTLAAFGVALRFGSETLRLDALGTHLVENAIGIARATSSDPRYERILSTFTHAELRKTIACELNVTIHIPGRVNSGGCKIAPDYAVEEPQVSKPESWRVDGIIQLFHGLMIPELAEVLKDDAKPFIAELFSISEKLDEYEYEVNDAANSTIMARLIKFQ